jgi:RND family efflux transporter MFP subunit
LHQNDLSPATGNARKHRGTGKRSGSGPGRRIQIVAVGIVVVLIVAYFAVHYSRSRSENELASVTKEQMAVPPAVVVVTAQKAPSVYSLALPGDTAAWFASTIYARVDGYVGQWFVDIGDHVKKGQVLATIETPDLDASRAASVAKLKAAEAEVLVRRAQAGFAKTTYDRWRNSPKGVVSEQETESKKADYSSAAAQINAALAQASADQGDIDRLTALSRFKKVTAPYDGTIIQRGIDIGNLVTAGSTASTTLLYRVTRDDPIRVFVDAPQNVAAEMTVGRSVTILASDMPGHPFHGKITRTADAVDPQSRTLRVEVDIPNPDDLLVPGLYVQAAFQLEAKGRVQVPASAMVFRSKGPQVAVVGKEGRVKFNDVEIARDDGDVVELGSGVSPGDQIVLNISNQIADGEKVAVTVQDQGLASAAPVPLPAR